MNHAFSLLIFQNKLFHLQIKVLLFNNINVGVVKELSFKVV
jgi:hypothetical protein